QIPLKEIKTPVAMMGEAIITPGFYTTIPYHGNWALANASSDTVYNFLPDGNTMPFIVRTPSIHTMEPEVFLYPTALTDRYYFMHIFRKEFDFEKMKGFPGTDLVYDRQEKAIFEYTACNDDYSNKKQVYMTTIPVNDEIATWQSLEAHRLVESYEKGELKGRLKEIAAELDEESNPVIMLIKHKK
ncbi:MAG: 6-bladed beta-propeller, partial [Tannerella sp.]|nr:6-bladed beta-propeller [Tannerella sp.]